MNDCLKLFGLVVSGRLVANVASRVRLVPYFTQIPHKLNHEKPDVGGGPETKD